MTRVIEAAIDRFGDTSRQTRLVDDIAKHIIPEGDIVPPSGSPWDKLQTVRFNTIAKQPLLSIG